MPSLLSPRRTTPELSLHAAPAQREPTSAEGSNLAAPPFGWPLAAVVGGLITALASWILCAGLAVVGWLAADPGTLGQALTVGTRLWLLSNGVSAPIGSLAVTLIPWGATAVTAFMLSRFAAFGGGAGQSAGPGGGGGGGDGRGLGAGAAGRGRAGGARGGATGWGGGVSVWARAAGGGGGGGAGGGGPGGGRPGWSRSRRGVISAAWGVLGGGGGGVGLTGGGVHGEGVTGGGELGGSRWRGVALFCSLSAGGGGVFLWGPLGGGGFRLGPGGWVGGSAGRAGGGLPGGLLLGARRSGGAGETRGLGGRVAGDRGGAGAAGVMAIPAGEAVRHQQPDRGARRVARRGDVRRPGLGREW